jgi:hypothetical protein
MYLLYGRKENRLSFCPSFAVHMLVLGLQMLIHLLHTGVEAVAYRSCFPAAEHYTLLG